MTDRLHLPPEGDASHAAEDLFRAGFDAMLDSVLILSAIRGTDGSIVDLRFEFLNSVAHEAFHNVSADMLSTTVLAAFPNSVDSGLFSALCEVVESGSPLSLEVPWSDSIHGDSTWEITASRLADGLISVVRDLTERTQILMESRERELRYRLLADHAGDVAALSQNGVIVWVGPSVTDLLGWQPEELAGRTVWSLTHAEDLPKLLEFRSELDRASPRKVRVRMAHKDGTYRWMDNCSRIATEAGMPGAVVSVMWSVEAEVEALEALERARAERVGLERRMQVAERLESLGVLAGGVAHDFNNLLVGILGNAELARDHLGDTALLRTLLDQLVHAGERAADLTRQMLDYAGQRSTPVDRVDIGALIAETVSVIRPNIAEGAAVSLHVEPDLPDVPADVTQLRQVVMNLVINASDSLDGRPGTVTVVVSGRNVDEQEAMALAPFNPPRPGAFVVLEVMDTGRGMGADTIAKMFEPFFTTGSTGRGLGLSVVHGAVRSLGGAIEVISQLRQGTTIRVFLPAGDPAGDALRPPVIPASDRGRTPPADPGAAPAPPRSPQSMGTVLVVDDEAVVARMIERALSATGYEVRTASGPEMGIVLFNEDPEAYSVAVVDVTMPVMNGVAMAAALHAVCPRLPIVLMSGYTADDLGVELGDVRFRFLPKPFRIDELVETVAAAITGP